MIAEADPLHVVRDSISAMRDHVAATVTRLVTWLVLGAASANLLALNALLSKQLVPSLPVGIGMSCLALAWASAAVAYGGFAYSGLRAFSWTTEIIADLERLRIYAKQRDFTVDFDALFRERIAKFRRKARRRNAAIVAATMICTLMLAVGGVAMGVAAFWQEI